MKNFVLPLIAASALLLGACSTQQLAQQSSGDDVYYTEAKAKEVTLPVPAAQTKQADRSYRTDEQLYGGGDYTDRGYYDDYNFDYGYASRLNRFYGRSPWRSSYYDSWYSYSYMPWYTYRYDPFYYDPWYYSPGSSIWVGIGSYPRYGYGGYNTWGYYGSPYNNNYWGPYSYYNTVPGYGYGGGYYSDGGYVREQRARPNRGGNEIYTPSNRGTIVTGGTQRNTTSGGRVSSGTQGSSNTRSRPTGPDYNTTTRERQPTTSSTRESQPTTQTERSAPAPSNSGGGGSSSGGDNSRSRPSRGGN